MKFKNIYSIKIIVVAIKTGEIDKSIISINIAPNIKPDNFYYIDHTLTISIFNQLKDKKTLEHC